MKFWTRLACLGMGCNGGIFTHDKKYSGEKFLYLTGDYYLFTNYYFPWNGVLNS
jgi:hypothetical protein